MEALSWASAHRDRQLAGFTTSCASPASARTRPTAPIWTTPFQPDTRAGRLYARGTSDNRSPHWAMLCALEATVMVSCAVANSNIHAPNEFIRLQSLDDGIREWLHLLPELAG